MAKLSIREIRERLNNLQDTEIESFCQENYYEVYNNFTRGLRKDEKITLLIDFVVRRSQIDELISLLEGVADSIKTGPSYKWPNKPELDFYTIKLHLQSIENNRLRIRGMDIPGGGIPVRDSALPFTLSQLKAVLKALEVGKYEPARFKTEYSEILRELGLLVGNHLHADMYKIIGRRLYDSIFRDEILVALRKAQEKGNVICQLLFDPDDSVAAQYPWELAYDGNVFLSLTKSGIEIVRCIYIPNAVQELHFDFPIKVLYVSPRPKDDDFLPTGLEKQFIETGLDKLIQRGLAKVVTVTPSTYIELKKELSLTNYAILHFDGHGSFSKNCPNCQLAHYPSQTTCLNCGEPLDRDDAFGYLHFETETGFLDKINIDDFKTLVVNRGMQMMVLTSCNSSVSKDGSLFNGIAPGLIQGNIPAVIAMQGSPSVEAMNGFVLTLYTELSKGKRIPDAVNSARLSIYRLKPASWFLPTVFIRTLNNNAMAFASQNEKGV